MQKKIIALAVAALASGAAFAQSNVTVYGVADVSFESAKATGATAGGTDVGSRARVQTNSSYIGFKGAEDLGNGLKALFQFETAVNLDTTVNPGGTTTPTVTAATGASSFGAARDSFVALNGGFGTVLAGYVSTPHRNVFASFDVVPGAAGVGNANGVFGKVTNGVNSFFRTQAVAYASPVFSGFSGVIAYVPNEGKSVNGTANQVNPNGWNLGLNYANGGLKLAYSHLKLNDVGAQNNAATTTAYAQGVGVAGLTDESHKFDLFAAAYDFGQGTTVSGMYQKFKGNAAAGAVSGDAKLSSYFLGAKHVLGANEFAVSYQHAGQVKGSLGAADTGASQWTLRYGYNFSKRTQAYALYSKISNKAAANYDFNSSYSNGGVGGFSAGADPQVYGVGIRHSF